MGDNIKKPDHYCEGREYEPKDVIQDWGLNFNLGSAVKYISRAGRKGDKLEDLKKAKQFLEFEIEAVTKETMRHVDPFDYTNFEDYLKAIRANKECISDDKEQKDDIGMTCKEAAEIGDAIAKGYEEAFKISEEIDTEIEIERKASWYTNGILGQWYYYQNIPDEYKSGVIDRIVEMVTNGMENTVRVAINFNEKED